MILVITIIMINIQSIPTITPIMAALLLLVPSQFPTYMYKCMTVVNIQTFCKTFNVLPWNKVLLKLQLKIKITP